MRFLSSSFFCFFFFFVFCVLCVLILSAFLVFVIYLLQQTQKTLDYINSVSTRKKKNEHEVKKHKNQFISTSNCQFLDILNYSKGKKRKKKKKINHIKRFHFLSFSFQSALHIFYLYSHFVKSDV